VSIAAGALRKAASGILPHAALVHPCTSRMLRDRGCDPLLQLIFL